jgi:hypothetical protein
VEDGHEIVVGAPDEAQLTAQRPDDGALIATKTRPTAAAPIAARDHNRRTGPAGSVVKPSTP